MACWLHNTGGLHAACFAFTIGSAAAATMSVVRMMLASNTHRGCWCYCTIWGLLLFPLFRSSICAAMSFCMSHGSSSAEVCSCLTESLTLPDTALTMRLARTYLLSDLLANSGGQTPHAWTYRHHLEKSLPVIAEHWSKGASFIQLVEALPFLIDMFVRGFVLNDSLKETLQLRCCGSCDCYICGCYDVFGDAATGVGAHAGCFL